MKRIRSAIQVACLLAFCAALPPALSGCGGSESTSSAATKFDPVQAKTAQEATAKANAERLKSQAKHR